MSLSNYNIIPILIVCGVLSFGCQTTVSSGVKPDPISGGENPIDPGEEDSERIFYQLGDRNFVEARLRQVFIPDSGGLSGADLIERDQLVTLILRFVTQKPYDFGGACDLYALDPNDCGGDISRAFAPSSSQLTTSRAALTLRISLELLNTTSRELALRTAISKTRGVALSSIDISTVSSPNLQDVQSALSLIYPSLSPSSETLNRLLELSNFGTQSSSQAKDGWRFLFLALLSSTAWQIL